MLTSVEIARMSSADRMGEAMRLSLPHVPAGARTVVESMLTPETLTIVTGTLAVWAGAHCFGAGEIVDLILLGQVLSHSVLPCSRDRVSCTTSRPVRLKHAPRPTWNEPAAILLKRSHCSGYLRFKGYCCAGKGGLSCRAVYVHEFVQG
jgi:hypothetical protein